MNPQKNILRICLPIIQDSVASVLAIIEQAPSSYQIFEIWADYVLDFSPSSIADLLRACGDRELLFLFRRQNSVAPRLPLSQRLALIETLISHQQSQSIAIDFDIHTQREEIEWLSTQTYTNTVILSYHNYQETPATSELDAISAEMWNHNATISKFSTFCQSPEDALRLLELLVTLRKNDRRCTVLGMGAYGLITRVFGPLWGSEIAYAPQVMAHSSAPGQLTLSELQELLEKLRIVHER